MVRNVSRNRIVGIGNDGERESEEEGGPKSHVRYPLGHSHCLHFCTKRNQPDWRPTYVADFA